MIQNCIFVCSIGCKDGILSENDKLIHPLYECNKEIKENVHNTHNVDFHIVIAFTISKFCIIRIHSIIRC